MRPVGTLAVAAALLFSVVAEVTIGAAAAADKRKPAAHADGWGANVTAADEHGSKKRDARRAPPAAGEIAPQLSSPPITSPAPRGALAPAAAPQAPEPAASAAAAATAPFSAPHAAAAEPSSAHEDAKHAVPPAAAKPAEDAKTAASAPSPVPDSAAVQNYCVNIANPAADARAARQKKQLEDLKGQIAQRVTALEAKIAEHKEWLDRFNSFADKARDSLVGIYASMKAEAAAKQLAEIDEETAAAVVAKLDARQSSAILSEMETKKAARLMEIVAGSAKRPEELASADKASTSAPAAAPAATEPPAAEPAPAAGAADSAGHEVP